MNRGTASAIARATRAAAAAAAGAGAATQSAELRSGGLTHLKKIDDAVGWTHFIRVMSAAFQFLI